MCVKPPKPAGKPTTPTAVIPPTAPITDQVPSTQSGADQAAAAADQKPRKKSLFQIDLSIPEPGAGANAGGGQGGTGAKV